MTGHSPRRAAVVVATALLLATPLAVATVSAHGNHVAADSQVTSEGRVVVETVSALNPGFVVVRADEGDRPGDPLGHVFVERTPDLTYRTSVPVPIDESTWDEWSGNRSVWVVLHDDTDGDGEFDFGTDVSAARRSPAASTWITVRKGEDGQARVLGATFEGQPVTDGAITVRQVDLPAAGHVVVSPVGSDAHIGSRSLSAGTHRNVTVPVNESFVAEQSSDFRVSVLAHRDDGDGEFGPSDPVVTAGDRTVGTYLTLAPGDETDDGPLVNTPTVTTEPPSETPTATDSDGAGEPGDTATDTATDSTTAGPGGTAGSGPGFGVGLAVLALAAATLAARPRRR